MNLRFCKKIALLTLCTAMACSAGTAGASDASAVREISWQELDSVQVGNAQDDQAKTGVTVLYFPQTAIAGVDISGGGPASRETPVLSPLTNPTPLNAIVLSGGSAYGLAAADGVMTTLEKHGIGYDTRCALVPIVCQSDIYDLSYGASNVRPDARMGAEAAENALAGTHPLSGNVGAGTGATVGKVCGMKRAMKSGIGYSAAQLGDLKIGAVVVVNALGDVYDPASGQKIAGLRDESRQRFVSGAEQLYARQKANDRTNTTIGAIVTNGDFNKAELTKIAEMTRCAYARCINPIGTMADGDTIYAAASGKRVKADISTAGTLAAEVMARAIQNAIKSSQITDEEYLRNCR